LNGDFQKVQRRAAQKTLHAFLVAKWLKTFIEIRHNAEKRLEQSEK